LGALLGSRDTTSPNPFPFPLRPLIPLAANGPTRTIRSSGATSEGHPGPFRPKDPLNGMRTGVSPSSPLFLLYLLIQILVHLVFSSISLSPSFCSFFKFSTSSVYFRTRLGVDTERLAITNERLLLCFINIILLCIVKMIPTIYTAIQLELLSSLLSSLSLQFFLYSHFDNYAVDIYLHFLSYITFYLS